MRLSSTKPDLAELHTIFNEYSNAMSRVPTFAHARTKRHALAARVLSSVVVPAPTRLLLGRVMPLLLPALRLDVRRRLE